MRQRFFNTREIRISNLGKYEPLNVNLKMYFENYACILIIFGNNDKYLLATKHI